MIQAAAEKVIDFSQTAFYDYRWQIRTYMLLDWIQQKNRRESKIVQLQSWYGAIASPLVAADARNKVLEVCHELGDAIRASYLGQTAKTASEAREELAKRDVSDWEQQYGNLKDADTQEKLAEVVAGMERLMKETAAIGDSLPTPGRKYRG